MDVLCIYECIYECIYVFTCDATDSLRVRRKCAMTSSDGLLSVAAASHRNRKIADEKRTRTRIVRTLNAPISGVASSRVEYCELS